MENDLIYLDTYILQQDMRIRLPKSILTNLSVERGTSKFNIFFDKKNNSIVLKVERSEEENQ
ncbi:MAG: sucrose-6-phosphate hydrolase [Clostridiaceae bacterium]|nr:sucrose-6-phosphate hydrolase [Clostridiaceae bacterium]